MKELTKAEEQVMHILWKLKNAIVKEIVEMMENPKPAYSTVSTVVRVLENKGFVNHRAEGYSHIYFPIISEKEYKHFAFDKVMNSFFDNSYHDLVSFLVNEKDIDHKQIEELTSLVEKLKNKK